MEKTEISSTAQNIINNTICIFSGVLIYNFYSICVLILNNQWKTTSDIIKILNENNAIQSVITVEIFNITGIAFVFFGIFNMIRQVFLAIKTKVKVRRADN